MTIMIVILMIYEFINVNASMQFDKKQNKQKLKL